MLTETELVNVECELEKLYDKNQLTSRIKREFKTCQNFDFEKYLTDKGISAAFGLDVLVQMAIHKRAKPNTLIGILYHHYNSAQLTIDWLMKCAEADIMDYSEALDMFIVRYSIGPEVQEELDRYQYPMPMVIEPVTVYSNKDTGYFIQSRGSLILKDNHHDFDINLEHINRLNKVKLSLNLDTAHMVKNQWRNLDKPKEGETKQEFERRKKAFEKYDRSAHFVMDKITSVTDHFYLTHRYDKRGRTYCMGYHVNYQGTPWNKAVIEFHEKELVT